VEVFEFFKSIVPFITPVFVISTMLNVGLTQKLSDILGHLKNGPFVLKMLLANFVLAPILMIVTLRFMPFDPALKAGLLLFSLCAGAPFLIKLTQLAEHKVAIGAAIMMLLMIATVLYVPIVLPRVLTGITVDAWAITRTLALQLLLPIAAGMLIVQILPGPAIKAQPWIGRLGNLALYAVIAATLIGYLPNMIAIVGTGAILVSLAFVAVAFGIGYVMGGGTDHLEDLGGLGTAQRNTAAGLLIATQNFRDPNVLVMITLANTLGIVMLLIIARALSRDNEVDVVTV
jgi:BASS family bile acid:Na+ symporter